MPDDPDDAPSPEAAPDDSSAAAKSRPSKGFWARAKDHPVIIAMGVIAAVIGFVFLLLDLPGNLRDGIQGFARDMGWMAEPTPTGSLDPLLAGIDQVELGMTRDAVSARIGEPVQTFAQVCGDALFCDPADWPQLGMSLYDLGHAEVRALYDEDRLVFVSHTIVDAADLPPVDYLGRTLGTLGDMTYAQAVSALPQVEPNSFVALTGPDSAGYGEMFEAGGASQYVGLYLASAPSGYGTDLDLDSLALLTADSGDAEALERFRAASQPNTAGEFDAESPPFVALVAENLVAIALAGSGL